MQVYLSGAGEVIFIIVILALVASAGAKKKVIGVILRPSGTTKSKATPIEIIGGLFVIFVVIGLVQSC